MSEVGKLLMPLKAGFGLKLCYVALDMSVTVEAAVTCDFSIVLNT